VSVWAVHTVYCDHPDGDCLVWIGQEDTRSQARRIARAAGWACGVKDPRWPTVRFDLCAAHKPSPETACKACGARATIHPSHIQCRWDQSHRTTTPEGTTTG
jgi:hypothetical protein